MIKITIKYISSGSELALIFGPEDRLYRFAGPDTANTQTRITEELGADFPYFVSIGNHDNRAWDGPDGYQAKMQARLDRVEGANCSGNLGIKAACTYDGLFFILSAAATGGHPSIHLTRMH